MELFTLQPCIFLHKDKWLKETGSGPRSLVPWTCMAADMLNNDTDTLISVCITVPACLVSVYSSPCRFDMNSLHSVERLVLAFLEAGEEWKQFSVFRIVTLIRAKRHSFRGVFWFNCCAIIITGIMAEVGLFSSEDQMKSEPGCCSQDSASVLLLFIKPRSSTDTAYIHIMFT